MSNTNQHPFPEVLSSSILSNFKACPRKFELETIEGWKPHYKSIHLHAGGAYARGLEVARKAFYSEGLSEIESQDRGRSALLEFYGDFECPPESAKSAERTAGAFDYYFTQYPMPEEKAKPHVFDDGPHGIEFLFVEPLDIKHPTTGNPILYSGRLDAVVDFAGGIYGLDDKTSTTLGKQWLDSWDLRSQFAGYAWGLQRNSIKLNGFLIRGVSILKTKYNTMEALVQIPEWQVERWYKNLLINVRRMIDMWQEGYFDYNLDNSCVSYNGCEFKKVCMSREPDIWLQGFVQEKWNPITRETK